MPEFDKPKVLIIGSLPPPHHGCNVFVQQLLNSDLPKRFRVIHLDTSDRRSLDNITKLDFTNVFLAMLHLARLAMICVRHRPALAHLSISQNTFAFLRDGLFVLAIKLFTLGFTRVVIHLHGSYFSEFYRAVPWPVRWFVDATMRCVSRALVLGERLKPIFSPWLRDEHIEVVPNGSPIQPVLNGKFERNGRRPLQIIFLGNLFKFKGVLDILLAAEMVLAKHTDVKFRFAGSWGHDPIFDLDAERFRKECETCIARTGKPECFEFAGELVGMQVIDYLLDGDIFLLPSHVEGMPLAILEAMAAGNPVISTLEVGAIPDVVLHGETGILVEKQNPPALAQAMLELIENPRKRMEMGVAARRRFETFYTSEKSVARLMQVFEKTIS